MIPLWFVILIAVVGTVVGVFFLLCALEGYIDFKNKPREPMEWCTKHGHFRKQDCIEWSPGQKICPMCWQETMGKVEAQR